VVEPLGDGVFRVTTEDGRQRLAWATRVGSASWVFIDGATLVVDPAAPTSRKASGTDEAALSSPMPATVAAVHVSPGQAVSEGELLVTVEAMKMELAIRAPRTGTIRSVQCEVGELVQPGHPLVELER